MSNNRLDPLISVLKCHPRYLEHFLQIHQFILKGDGPLSFSFRHYIAIMASARQKCKYLVNVEEQEFLFCGGDKTWLSCLDFIPQKLKDLNEINKILAHQPWLINKGHIEKLNKRHKSWSISEIVQAIVVLVHFHSFSSLVFGCGLNDVNTSYLFGHSVNASNGHKKQVPVTDNHPSSSPKAPSSPTTPPSPASVDALLEGSVDMLIEKMQTITEHKLCDETSQEDLGKGFEKVESQNIEVKILSSKNETNESGLVKYLEDPDFCYMDFAKQREIHEIPTFRIQDYSWDDQGFSLANRLYPDIGSLLDEKFKVAYNLTYHTMGKKINIDTSMFRRAIWNYIQCMFGIRHDDYDYHEVNELLDRNFKSYIKTLCCFPYRISKKDCDNAMREFRESEKIHVNLMISEARMQAILLYALRAVMKFMT